MASTTEKLDCKLLSDATASYHGQARNIEITVLRCLRCTFDSFQVSWRSTGFVVTGNEPLDMVAASVEGRGSFVVCNTSNMDDEGRKSKHAIKISTYSVGTAPKSFHIAIPVHHIIKHQ